MTGPPADDAGRQSPGPDPRLLEFAQRHFGRAIRHATRADIAAMADIHVRSGTPGLLSDLGEAFLRDVFYRGILESPIGHGFVIEINGTIAGFETFSLNSDRLFAHVFRRRLGATLLALARAAIHKPRVLRDFVETVITVRSRGEAAAIPAESISLEVAPEFQGIGLGFLLLQAGVNELRALGAGRIKARILENNTAVERLYPPLGFRRAGRFKLHGRDWVLMVLDDAGR